MADQEDKLNDIPFEDVYDNNKELVVRCTMKELKIAKKGAT